MRFSLPRDGGSPDPAELKAEIAAAFPNWAASRPDSPLALIGRDWEPVVVERPRFLADSILEVDPEDVPSQLPGWLTLSLQKKVTDLVLNILLVLSADPDALAFRLTDAQCVATLDWLRHFSFTYRPRLEIEEIRVLWRQICRRRGLEDERSADWEAVTNLISESFYPDAPDSDFDLAQRLVDLAEMLDEEVEDRSYRFYFWHDIQDLDKFGSDLGLCLDLMRFEPGSRMAAECKFELSLAMDGIRDRIHLFFRVQTNEPRFKGIYGWDKSQAREITASFESMNRDQRVAVFYWIDRVLISWEDNAYSFLGDLDYPFDLVMDCLRTWAFEESE